MQSPDPGAQDIAVLHGLFESAAIWGRLDLDAPDLPLKALALSLPGQHPCTMSASDLLPLTTGHALAAHHLALISDVLVVAGLFSGRPEGRSTLLRALLRTPLLGKAVFRSRMSWCLSSEARFAAALRSAMQANTAAVAFVRSFFNTGKVVAAICHAPWLLIEAGVIEGRKVTSYGSIRTDVINAGGLWEDSAVVVDTGFVTARDPGDLDAFCAKIVEEVRKDRQARKAA